MGSATLFFLFSLAFATSAYRLRPVGGGPSGADDCTVEHQSPHHAVSLTGCAGATWSTGTASSQWCTNTGQGVDPWYRKCCSWDEGARACVAAVDFCQPIIESVEESRRRRHARREPEESLDPQAASVEEHVRVDRVNTYGWMTLPPSRGDDRLLAAAKRDGLYAPWSLPSPPPDHATTTNNNNNPVTAAGFTSFAAFRDAVRGKRILIVGDSIQMNFFISANNLWRGQLPNTSVGNTHNPKLHKNRAEYWQLAVEQAKCVHHASPFYALHAEVSENTNFGRCIQA